MSNARQFIEQIASGEASSAKETFETLLSTKAFEALDAYKKEIASNIFGGMSEEVEQIEESPKYPYTHHDTVEVPNKLAKVSHHLAQHRGQKGDNWHILRSVDRGHSVNTKVLHSGSEQEMKNKFKSMKEEFGEE
jgi:hypothetical protein